jgi:hypothetical protein
MEALKFISDYKCRHIEKCEQCMTHVRARRAAAHV